MRKELFVVNSPKKPICWNIVWLMESHLSIGGHLAKMSDVTRQIGTLG